MRESLSGPRSAGTAGPGRGAGGAVRRGSGPPAPRCAWDAAPCGWPCPRSAAPRGPPGERASPWAVGTWRAGSRDTWPRVRRGGAGVRLPASAPPASGPRRPRPPASPAPAPLAPRADRAWGGRRRGTAGCPGVAWVPAGPFAAVFPAATRGRVPARPLGTKRRGRGGSSPSRVVTAAREPRRGLAVPPDRPRRPFLAYRPVGEPSASGRGGRSCAAPFARSGPAGHGAGVGGARGWSRARPCPAVGSGSGSGSRGARGWGCAVLQGALEAPAWRRGGPER